MEKRRFSLILLLVGTVFFGAGCGGLHVNIGAESKKQPLKEYTLEGRGAGKVLVIPVRGFLSDAPRKGFLSDNSSVVEEIVAALRLAEKDEDIKAVLLEINSPGGSATASDILYHEIMEYKVRTKTKVVAVLMDVAASGGYYVALPADRIVAHPTSITGSVGVIFMVPKVKGLMDKLGLAVEVSKSGREKDIGSPFRPSTPEEQRILQGLTDALGKKFRDKVAEHRKTGTEAMTEIAGARIYLADEALQLRLIDRIGYVKDAILEAKELAGLPKDAKVVVYRRAKYPNDSVYNTSVSGYNGPAISSVELNLPEVTPAFEPGFYYLWTPGGAMR